MDVAVSVGAGEGVSTIGVSDGKPVGLASGVAIEAVDSGEAVTSGVCVAVVVGDRVAVAVGVLVGVGVAVLTAELENGPPKTLTAFVCARPPEAFTESPRTEVAPSGTNFGTLTFTFALPVALVVTRVSSTHDAPFFQRIRTTSPAAKPRKETLTVSPRLVRFGITFIRGLTVYTTCVSQCPYFQRIVCGPFGAAGILILPCDSPLMSVVVEPIVSPSQVIGASTSRGYRYR
jgi:hypothetical protein